MKTITIELDVNQASVLSGIILDSINGTPKLMVSVEGMMWDVLNDIKDKLHGIPNAKVYGNAEGTGELEQYLKYESDQRQEERERLIKACIEIKFPGIKNLKVSESEVTFTDERYTSEQISDFLNELKGYNPQQYLNEVGKRKEK